MLERQARRVQRLALETAQRFDQLGLAPFGNSRRPP